MKFNLRSFLRKCSSDVLVAYFNQVGVPFGRKNFDESGDATEFVDLIEGLETGSRDWVYADLEQAWQLRGEIGQRSLRESLGNDRQLLRHLNELPSDESRSLLVQVKKPAAFKEALAIFHAEN